MGFSRKCQTLRSKFWPAFDFNSMQTTYNFQWRFVFQSSKFISVHPVISLDQELDSNFERYLWRLLLLLSVFDQPPPFSKLLLYRNSLSLIVIRCLNPGKYSQHLERWLSYYPPQQLHIIDGDQLRSNPVETMNELQRFLKIQPPFDYSTHLR
jgi:hypothetical protein